MKGPKDKLTKGEIKSKKTWLQRKGLTAEDVEQIIGPDDQAELTAEDVERKIISYARLTQKHPRRGINVFGFNITRNK
jgi:hypothetical protein